MGLWWGGADARGLTGCDLPEPASLLGLGELLHSAKMPFLLFRDGDWLLGLQDRSRPAVRCVKALAKGCLVPGASISAERFTQGL